MLIQTALLLLAVRQGSPQSERDAGNHPFYIDASVQGYTRQILRRAMLNLATEDRENVVYIDHNGQAYANRPALLVELFRPVPLGNGRYSNAEGEVFTRSTIQLRPQSGSVVVPKVWPPNLRGGTGPYRRVYSRVPASATSAGYAWESANIHLPGSPDNYVSDPDHDVLFAYMGGWGGGSGTAIDAGWQYSPVYDWWTPIVQVEGVGPVAFTTMHYKTNQDANFKFYVPADNQVALAWTAIPYPTGTVTQRTYVYDVPAPSGWRVNGAGCVLKRMTTIGQSSEDFTTGSHLRGVRWYGCLIGASSTSNAAWSAASSGGFQRYPDEVNARTAPVIVPVSFTDQSNETVSVDIPYEG